MTYAWGIIAVVALVAPLGAVAASGDGRLYDRGTLVASGDVRIIGGDTISIGGVRVRFLGIDVPMLLEARAKEKVRVLIEEPFLAPPGMANKVVCQAEGRYEYGYLAVCSLWGDGALGDLARGLVGRGLAVARDARYRAAEAYARKEKLGIWRD